MSRRSGRKLMGEINVVPYIDVMLVLLIIFMVTAPMLSQGIKVDLPRAAAEPIAPDDLEPLLLSLLFEHGRGRPGLELRFGLWFGSGRESLLHGYDGCGLAHGLTRLHRRWQVLVTDNVALDRKLRRRWIRAPLNGRERERSHGQPMDDGRADPGPQITARSESHWSARPGSVPG